MFGVFNKQTRVAVSFFEPPKVPPFSRETHYPARLSEADEALRASNRGAKFRHSDASEISARVLEIVPPSPAPVPAELPAWRIKAVAAIHGLTPSITMILAALPEPQKTVAGLAWKEGNVIRRDSPTLLMLANALGLDSETLDGLFREAAALPV